MLLLGRVRENTSLEEKLCFSHTLVPELYVFRITFNVKTSIISTKCAYTKITVFNITDKQLGLDLKIVCMITIKMKCSIRCRFKAKFVVFRSRKLYTLPSVTIWTFNFQRTLSTTCTGNYSIWRCTNEGPQGVNDQTTVSYCEISVLPFHYHHIVFTC